MFRSTKRFAIILIYLFLFTGIASLVYLVAKPKPNCTDGKLNQGEEKVDCGGPCTPCPEVFQAKDLEVTESAIIPAGSENVDVVIRVRNPNDVFGTERLDVVLTLEDAGGVPLVTFRESSFILPRQEKYIVKPNVAVAGTPVRVKATLENIDWIKFSGYQEPEVIVSNKEYSPISSGVGFSELKGILKNNSTFDFRNLKVKAILRDGENKVLTVNSTDMQTVLAREEREFRMFWPNSFPGEVRKIEVEVEANFFQNDNFVRRYLEGGRFQY